MPIISAPGITKHLFLCFSSVKCIIKQTDHRDKENRHQDENYLVFKQIPLTSYTVRTKSSRWNLYFFELIVFKTSALSTDLLFSRLSTIFLVYQGEFTSHTSKRKKLPVFSHLRPKRRPYISRSQDRKTF